MLILGLKRSRWGGGESGHNESTISSFSTTAGWLCGELGHGTLILLLISLLFFKSTFFGLSVGALLTLERDTSSSIINKSNTNDNENNTFLKTFSL